MSSFSSPDNLALAAKDADVFIEVKQTPEELLVELYQLETCITWIIENNFRRTCLQFPDELLNDGVAVALYLEKELGKSFYVLADTAFGSCCVDHISAEHVQGDSVIHFGHACLSHFSKLPVLYIFLKKELDISIFKESVEKVLTTDCFVTIFYDDVYHHLYNDLCDSFRNSQVEISKIIIPGVNIESTKQKHLFGRTFEFPPNSDAVAVFLGDDCVTLQNLALALPDVKWYYYEKIGVLTEYEINRSKFLMKKYHQVEVVKHANVMGILIGTLGIERYLDAIERIKFLAKNHGKKCYILAVGRPNVCKLANFPEVDVFVTISCPENASKDFKEYYKPVVSLFEVEMALGNHLFRTEYLNDFQEVLLKYSALDEVDESNELNKSEMSLISGMIGGSIKLGGTQSSALQEKLPGVLMEAKGAEFLSSRSWRGLDQDLENNEVTKAEFGRSGIPLAYENEYGTLKMSPEDEEK